MELVQETSTQKKGLNQVNEKEEEYHEDNARRAKDGPIKHEMVNTTSEAEIKQ